MIMKSLAAALKKDQWLILILILGLFLRLIDINKPFSGLSGWNEAHYSMAPLNFFKYGLLTPVNDYGLDLSTTPILYWSIFSIFKIFGVHEWSARIPSLISGLLSIWLIYLISEKLYSREVANYSAFISAIAPGIVYFSRSVQLESMMAFFSLASILSLLKYCESKKGFWFFISTVLLSFAIFIKLSAIVIYPVLVWIWFNHHKSSKSKENLSNLFLYLILPLIPSLLWIYVGVLTTPQFIKTYFIRPGDILTSRTVLDALRLAAFKFVPWNFGNFQYYLLLAGIPILSISWRKHMPMILLSATWLVLVIKYPITYQNNWYYDYLALYGMAVLTGFLIVETQSFFRETINSPNFSKAITFFIVLILFFNISGYYDPFHVYFIEADEQFRSIGEPEPFYSAKQVAHENIKGRSVMVAWPSTMYYVGGDPEYVDAMHFQDKKIVDSIRGERYAYVVLYYAWNMEIQKALEDSVYEKIAPRAWRLKGNETN